MIGLLRVKWVACCAENFMRARYVTIGKGKVNGPFLGVPRIAVDKTGNPVDDRTMVPYVRSLI
jgi:hypothetical protein